MQKTNTKNIEEINKQFDVIDAKLHEIELINKSQKQNEK